MTKIWRAEGARGFWRGIVPLWCRDVPFYVVFFGVYEGSRAFCLRHLQPPGEATHDEGDAAQQAKTIIRPAEVTKEMTELPRTCATPASHLLLLHLWHARRSPMACPLLNMVLQLPDSC